MFVPIYSRSKAAMDERNVGKYVTITTEIFGREHR